MSLSQLPLSYCTNVHPAQTVAEVLTGLKTYTGPVARRLQRPLAAGLWLAHPVIRELLADSSQRAMLAATLADEGLVCYTLNAFPFGDFHSERVKDQVYLPDWSHPDRLRYTQGCAEVLSELLPADHEGSLSTVPLGFKGHSHTHHVQTVSFYDDCCSQLLQFTRFAARLYAETGKRIRLGLEPEPCCLLETSDETMQFFDRLWSLAEANDLLDEAQTTIGVCYDVCHQAVEFEAATHALESLRNFGIRVNKVHITHAVAAASPLQNPAVRAALEQLIEPRYLHQTFARQSHGAPVSVLDLSAELLETPPPAFAESDEWRVHFHVPIQLEQLGPLRTTHAELVEALTTIARWDYAPHLEVETYTWPVLPDGQRQPLVEGLTDELLAAYRLLDQIASQGERRS